MMPKKAQHESPEQAAATNSAKLHESGEPTTTPHSAVINDQGKTPNELEEKLKKTKEAITISSTQIDGFSQAHDKNQAEKNGLCKNVETLQASLDRLKNKLYDVQPEKNAEKHECSTWLHEHRHHILLAILFGLFVFTTAYPVYRFDDFIAQRQLKNQTQVERKSFVETQRIEDTQQNGRKRQFRAEDQHVQQNTAEVTLSQKTTTERVPNAGNGLDWNVVLAGLFVCVIYLIGYGFLIYIMIVVFQRYRRDRLMNGLQVEALSRVLGSLPSNNDYRERALGKLVATYMDDKEK